MLQGLKELNANLKLVKTFTEIELIQAMEVSQALVANHAKANHLKGKNLSAAERKAHSDPRFYAWSQKLVNSIHSEKVKVTAFNIKGEVSAGEKYAARVELGSANSRAFPFFGPALEKNSQEIINTFAAAVKKVIK